MAEQSVAEVEYRDIPGFPHYRAGSDGTIWSQHPRGGAAQFGVRDFSKLAWRKLNGKRHVRSGHIDVNVRVDGVKKYAKAHQLVLFAFVGPKPNGLECRHLNGNPADNRLANLCWGTRSENIRDAFRHGTIPPGGNIARHMERMRQVGVN